MIRAKDIMTKSVITLRPDDKLSTAINKLSVGGISGAPVVRGRRVVGIVSESDIVSALDIHTKINFSSLPQFALVLAAIESKKHQEFKSEMRFASKLMAKDIMSEDPVCVRKDSSLEHTAHTMSKHDVNRVCVLDEKGYLAGIITRNDIIRALAKL